MGQSPLDDTEEPSRGCINKSLPVAGHYFEWGKVYSEETTGLFRLHVWVDREYMGSKAIWAYGVPRDGWKVEQTLEQVLNSVVDSDE